MYESAQPERYVAFSREQKGGNPAGVVLAAEGLSDADMQEIAADADLPTTAFLTSVAPERELTDELAARKYAVRFFSPSRETPWCGQSLLAAGVAISERIGTGTLSFLTSVGEVTVDTAENAAGAIQAVLTGVDTKVESATVRAVEMVLGAIGWTPDNLDPLLPRRIAHAGAAHLILGAVNQDRLAKIQVKPGKLVEALNAVGLESVALVRKEDDRNLNLRVFLAQEKYGEDAASAATALALGAYLRDEGLTSSADTLTLHQGDEMGSPSELTLSYSASGERVRITGSVHLID